MSTEWDGSGGALQRLRVLDFSTHATGPFATQVLASLGATVLKVERPPAGDPERHGEYAMFVACNRGKHSVLVDAKQPDDLALLEQLLTDADVVVEGFRPGVADRLGFGFDRVRALQPQVIYVSLPGFGSTGPRAGARGYDTQYRALAGDLMLNAHGGAPAYSPASPVFDYATRDVCRVGRGDDAARPRSRRDASRGSDPRGWARVELRPPHRSPLRGRWARGR